VVHSDLEVPVRCHTLDVRRAQQRRASSHQGAATGKVVALFKVLIGKVATAERSKELTHSRATMGLVRGSMKR
jgi:hypothetical protein